MSDNVTLWQLLNKQRVVIPVIQRDYAQGRKGKAYIRRTFLNEIKKHLDESANLTLDFVYGNNESGCFQPLDGQQRLTTLWLIHWYISFMSHNLDEDKGILTKFSYKTRTSSTAFCRSLCEKMPRALHDPQGRSIADYIKTQTWFYSAWLQDPTISSMLRTISGESGSEKADNIEDVFNGVDFAAYRKRLIEDNIVSFKLMVIGTEKLPLSDDLYIKMNARGKSLTDFENFKADLVAWIQSDDNGESQKYKQPSGHKNLEYRQYYPSQMDNEWTDVFWKTAKESLGDQFDGNIDESYFSFINRYVLNEMCLRNENNASEYAPKNKNKNLDDNPIKKAFDKLFGTGLRDGSPDDSLIAYEGFHIYQEYLTFPTLQAIDTILKALNKDHIRSCVTEALHIGDMDEETSQDKTAGDNKSAYTFIPRYDDKGGNKKLISTRQKERVYFLSVCLYLKNLNEQNEFDEQKFKRWMRVVKNLTENAAIENIPSMITCLRLIKDLGEKANSAGWNIYKCLENYTYTGAESQLERQLWEEKEKAKQMIADESWESKIQEAENFAFFNGAIRFLFRNAQGDICWENFDIKLKNAKKRFSSDNLVSITTVIDFLNMFVGFDEIKEQHVFTTIGYHRRKACWKKTILCSDDPITQSKVHDFLMNNSGPTHKAGNYKKFLDSGMAAYICQKADNDKYRYHWYNNDSAIHKERSQTECVYVSDDRIKKNVIFNTLVQEGKFILVNEKYNKYQNDFYWGTEIRFEYNGKQYSWNGDGKIYKIIDNRHEEVCSAWDDRNPLIQALEK